MAGKRLASELGRSVEALQQSATLAEQHARRREQADRGEAAAQERRVARRAYEAAARARAQAEEWLKMLEARDA